MNKIDKSRQSASVTHPVDSVATPPEEGTTNLYITIHDESIRCVPLRLEHVHRRDLPEDRGKNIPSGEGIIGVCYKAAAYWMNTIDKSGQSASVTHPFPTNRD